jgi:hypothetical protein
VIGDNMAKAIGRLWGCLTHDHNPEAPVILKLQDGYDIATETDEIKFLRSGAAAAEVVLDNGWVSHDLIEGIDYNSESRRAVGQWDGTA